MKLLLGVTIALPVLAQTPADAIKKQIASVAIQRDAVRKQAAIAAQYRVAAEPVMVPEPVCDPLPEPELTPLIDAAAQAHQIETKLLRAVIAQESASRPCAVSDKGASGLMQLMPSVIEQFKIVDPFDPKQNVEAGAEYLRQLLDKYKGDLSLVLAAFNAGPAAVDQAGGIPDIKETKDYVDAILKTVR